MLAKLKKIDHQDRSLYQKHLAVLCDITLVGAYISIFGVMPTFFGWRDVFMKMRMKIKTKLDIFETKTKTHIMCVSLFF